MKKVKGVEKNYKAPVISSRLIYKIAKKDADAFESLYNKTSSSVFGLSLAILNNRQKAEDVMQEVYVKIFEKASTYKNQGKPMAWIFTITRNLSLMELRKKHNTNVNIDDFYSIKDQSNSYAQIENKILLDGLLKILKDDERQIVMMHSLSQLKHREIAKILDMPISTVLSKYNRSIKKIREGVKDEK